VDECKPLPATVARPRPPPVRMTVARACSQGLTLVHFSAQRKRFLWDRGYILGLFWGCSGCLRGYEGVYRVRVCVINGSG